MAKEPYSVFDDKDLYQAPETREWNARTATGWRRILSGPDKGHWQLWREGKKVSGKVDRSGVKDILNFSGTGWGKNKKKVAEKDWLYQSGNQPTTIPPAKEEARDDYTQDLEFTMGFNSDTSALGEGLTEAFTKNLGTWHDETDTTNLGLLYGIINNDAVSKETGNKGGFFDKLSNSFSTVGPGGEPLDQSNVGDNNFGPYVRNQQRIDDEAGLYQPTDLTDSQAEMQGKYSDASLGVGEGETKEWTTNDPIPGTKDLTIGSQPWKRGSGSTIHEANAATRKILEEKGYDLRHVKDVDNLARRYRSGSMGYKDAVKAGRGFWVDNMFIRKR